MNRPNLEAIRKRYKRYAPIDPNFRISAFEDIEALLTYIDELEERLRAMTPPGYEQS